MCNGDGARRKLLKIVSSDGAMMGYSSLTFSSGSIRLRSSIFTSKKEDKEYRGRDVVVTLLCNPRLSRKRVVVGYSTRLPRATK